MSKDSSAINYSREEETLNLSVLTRRAAKQAVDLKKSQWSILSESTAEGQHNACEMPANYVQRAGNSVGGRKSLNLKAEEASTSLYDRISDALSSHLLSLQIRDIFCTEETWRASSDDQIKEGQFKNR